MKTLRPTPRDLENLAIIAFIETARRNGVPITESDVIRVALADYVKHADSRAVEAARKEIKRQAK